MEKKCGCGKNKDKEACDSCIGNNDSTIQEVDANEIDEEEEE